MGCCSQKQPDGGGVVPLRPRAARDVRGDHNHKVFVDGVEVRVAVRGMLFVIDFYTLGRK
jgi:hypothetical protein